MKVEREGEGEDESMTEGVKEGEGDIEGLKLNSDDPLSTLLAEREYVEQEEGFGEALALPRPTRLGERGAV